MEPTGDELPTGAIARIGHDEIATGDGRPPIAPEDGLACVPFFAPDGGLFVHVTFPWFPPRRSVLARVDPRTGRLLGRSEMPDRLTATGFRPDGSLVGTLDGGALVFVDPRTGAERRRLPTRSFRAVPHFFEGGTLVAVEDGVYDVATGRRLRALETYEEPRSTRSPAGFATRGRWLLVSYASDEYAGCIFAFDQTTGEGPIETTIPWTLALFFTRGGRLLVEGHDGGAIYDFERLAARRQPLTKARHSPSTSVNRACEEEFVERPTVATLPASTRPYATVQSPDGTRIARCLGETISVCDSETGAEVRRLHHEGRVEALAFSPDGLIASSGGGTVVTWSAPA